MPVSKSEIVQEMSRVLQMEAAAIQACSDRLRTEPHATLFPKAVELMQASLEQGGKIVVTGVGKSGKIAQKIAATLSSTGSLAIFLHPTEGLHGDLGVVTSRDCVLALSYTGNTEELVKLVPSLKGLAVPLIGLGGNSSSQLAQKCDVWLDAFVEQEACPHNLAPTTSTTLALAVGDALAVALMKVRGFDARSFAQNHPGGALGRRLHLRVSDIMHHGEAIPRIASHASMDEIILVSTEKKLGAALIVEGERLLGIITDGDLRRALQHQERFFQLKASDIMTPSPTSVRPDTMAQAALELMENRNKKITILPVLDERDRVVGIIHIHDLIQSL